MVLVVIILAFLLLAIVVATDLSAWTGIVTQAPQGVANFPRYVNEIGIATILGAISPLRRSRRRQQPLPEQLHPRQGHGHGSPYPPYRLPHHRRRGGQAVHRLLVRGERGEHASLERLVEGRQPGAAPDLRRHRVGYAHRPLRACRLGPWRRNLRRSREHRLLEGRGEGARQ